MVPLVTISCERNDKLNIAIRDNKLVLAAADDNDKTQQWFKDSCGIGNLTDNDGQKAFALVNKANTQVMVSKRVSKRVEASDGLIPVQLAPYKGDERVDISMLWTENKQAQAQAQAQHDLRLVRALGDNSMVLVAGLTAASVKEGTVVGICEAPAKPAGHQLWRILPIRP